jgi:poly(A) polymerase
MEVTRKPHLHQDWIDSHAYGIVKALQRGGYTTFLVGGCVRDLLVGIHPKDFDIVTMAHPPQVKRLIYMAFVIGKRFRLVLVKRDQQQFEVATFRSAVDPAQLPEDTPFGDNVFGTPEEDAVRRDFTINGLLYDPINDQLIDYVNGLPDIKDRVLRMIGEPDKRLIEDPIRILRGLRLSHKLGFRIDPELRAAMERNASELNKSVLPRRREEVLKILRLENPIAALLECYDLGILKVVIPTLHDFLGTTERRDLFIQHFETYQALVNDYNDTSQLFAWLIYSMLMAALEAPSQRETPLTIEDDIFQLCMRDELGMYKFEQTAVIKAIELLPSIAKVEEFRRRGERRQLGLIRNEGFRLALRFGLADYLLTPRDLAFWQNALEKMSVEIEEFEAEAKAKKRRPRRRKRTDQSGSDERLVGADSDLDADLETELDTDTKVTDKGG